MSITSIPKYCTEIYILFLPLVCFVPRYRSAQCLLGESGHGKKVFRGLHTKKDPTTTMETSSIDIETSPAYRRRAGDGAVFTSSKCPPGPGLKNSCELPFGFVWTPMSPSDTVAYIPPKGGGGRQPHTEEDNISDTTTLPPVLCLTCLSYINLYATFEEATGIWTCPLCGERNVAPPHMFGAPQNDGQSQMSLAMVSPLVEYRQKISNTPRGPSSSCYVFVLDGNLPTTEVLAVAKAIQSFLRIETQRQRHSRNNNTISIGLIVFTDTISLYQLGVSGVASADVFDPFTTANHDDNNNEPHRADDLVWQRRNRMQQRYYLTPVKNAQHDLDPFWQCLSAVYGTPLDPNKMETNENNGSTSTSSSEKKAPKMSRKEQLRLRKEARQRKQLQQKDTNGHNSSTTATRQIPSDSPWVLKSQKKISLQARCTVEAIQYAIDMVAFGSPDEPPRTSRIVLCTNGCANVGLGSVIRVPEELPQRQGSTTAATGTNTYYPQQQTHVIDSHHLENSIKQFALVGRDALEWGIGFDVFCSGSESLALSTYDALVEASGGYVKSHETFAVPQFQYNFDFLLSQTHMSHSGYAEDGSLQNVMNKLEGCVVDIRVSSFITPTHVVGPGEVNYTDEHGSMAQNERSAFAAGSALAAKHGFQTNNLPSKEVLSSSLTRYRLGRYDPLATMSVMLQVNDLVLPEDRHGFFQFIVRHVDPAGEYLMTRVCTHRLPLARDVHDFLDSMDEEVVPVVLGKEAVYRSIMSRKEPGDAQKIAIDIDRVEMLAYETQSDLDATINKISGAFRLLGLEEGNRSQSNDLTEEGGVPAARGSIDFAFPPELADALHRLYHLRRGSLISPGPLQSLDDRAEKRSLFLRLPLDDCLCMMAPSLWSSNFYSSLEPIPSDTLALWSSCVIAADHHDGLFVWSGRETVGADYDAIRQNCVEFLNERSYNRFPMPEFYMLSEGDSMSRRITALLAPSHADPPEQQLVHFPALANLTPAELNALREKFRFYDASSDASFRVWFWSVASASSNARKEGLSLCM